jgi:small subunit ribosomal protein S17
MSESENEPSSTPTEETPAEETTVTEVAEATEAMVNPPTRMSIVADTDRGRRKTLVGTVVSVKMDKTAVVAVERSERHPLYRKIVRSTKRYKAHDPNNSAVLGDVVRIIESRPISKEKRWRIAETMTRGNVADVAPRDIGMPVEESAT